MCEVAFIPVYLGALELSPRTGGCAGSVSGATLRIPVSALKGPMSVSCSDVKRTTVQFDLISDVDRCGADRT